MRGVETGDTKQLNNESKAGLDLQASGSDLDRLRIFFVPSLEFPAEGMYGTLGTATYYG